MESRSWRDVAEGRAACDAPRLRVRAQRMSVAPDRFARDFLCASLPSADHPGRWINILVRADAATTVLRDPSSAELSACVADFLAACRAD